MHQPPPRQHWRVSTKPPFLGSRHPMRCDVWNVSLRSTHFATHEKQRMCHSDLSTLLLMKSRQSKKGRLRGLYRKLKITSFHNTAPQPIQPLQPHEPPLQTDSFSSIAPDRSFCKQPTMVKIVVPSHCSRYIITATDLENYLRSHFGEGHDFQIEVFPELLPDAIDFHQLTDLNRQHTNDLWHFESPRDLSDVCCRHKHLIV
ncbi:hypothetical protein F5883DRAFT_254922 [Diaporthe sp. PMI_573]|nr:hypothetical protein F5883DRAFT_254922 [Diaporthaceae sp. PMI_573]